MTKTFWTHSAGPQLDELVDCIEELQNKHEVLIMNQAESGGRTALRSRVRNHLETYERTHPKLFVCTEFTYGTRRRLSAKALRNGRKMGFSSKFFRSFRDRVDEARVPQEADVTEANGLQTQTRSTELPCEEVPAMSDEPQPMQKKNAELVKAVADMVQWDDVNPKNSNRCPEYVRNKLLVWAQLVSEGWREKDSGPGIQDTRLDMSSRQAAPGTTQRCGLQRQMMANPSICVLPIRLALSSALELAAKNCEAYNCRCK